MKICHDRLLPRDHWTPQLKQRTRGRLRAVSPIGKAWPTGSTLRVKFLGGTQRTQDAVMAEALTWTKHANLKFEVTTANDAEIRVAFDRADGAWSYLGTDCREIPLQHPTMNLGFLDGGTPTHEFGHAIGLGHEHQNPEGGIQWNEQAVIRDLSGPPNFWDEEMIRFNVLEKYRADQINGTRFDPDSVMLYWFPKSWTTNGIETKQNARLSAVDGAFVASEKMYPATGITPDTAVEIQVDAKKPTRASIGKPGEEDLFFFTVTKEGRYAVATGGRLDAFLKLYGPDSSTNLIAQDNDSGYGAAARVVVTLRRGIYLVQIRHFRPTGTGSYTVKVTTAK